LVDLLLTILFGAQSGCVSGCVFVRLFYAAFDALSFCSVLNNFACISFLSPSSWIALSHPASLSAGAT